MKRAIFVLALLASGCASDMRAAENDPANPSATVAALDLGTGVLSSSFSPESIAPAADPHAGHDMGEHGEHVHGEHVHPPTPDATAEPTATASATASASSPPRSTAKRPAVPAATVYTCMHHPEVMSTAKGQCPKCGMDLVPKKPGNGGPK